MFNWLFKPPAFTRYQDSFALTKTAMWNGVQQAILARAEKGELIFLVAHFMSTFETLQERLEEWELDYEVVTRPVDIEWLRSSENPGAEGGTAASGSIYLVHASLLSDSFPEKESDSAARPIALMVVERHPLTTYDRSIEQFARSAPNQVQLGYFLSLEDPVIKKVIDPNVIELMQNLGMNENELISSSMLASRIEKLLSRLTKATKTDHASDSPEEWIELNLGE